MKQQQQQQFIIQCNLLPKFIHLFFYLFIVTSSMAEKWGQGEAEGAIVPPLIYKEEGGGG